ncbi:MAG: hypothetical protein R3E12_00145 [Candidatus Eisenbacteria bacterium]
MQVPDTADVALISLSERTESPWTETVVNRVLVGNVTGTQTFDIDALHLQLQAPVPASSFSGGSIINVTNGSLIDGAGQINSSLPQPHRFGPGCARQSRWRRWRPFGQRHEQPERRVQPQCRGFPQRAVGDLHDRERFLRTIRSRSPAAAGSAFRDVRNPHRRRGRLLNSTSIGTTRVLDAQVTNNGSIAVVADLDINRGDANHVNNPV